MMTLYKTIKDPRNNEKRCTHIEHNKIGLAALCFRPCSCKDNPDYGDDCRDQKVNATKGKQWIQLILSKLIFELTQVDIVNYTKKIFSTNLYLTSKQSKMSHKINKRYLKWGTVLSFLHRVLFSLERTGTRSSILSSLCAFKIHFDTKNNQFLTKTTIL